MRWKIVVVNSLILLALGTLTFWLMTLSFQDVVANPAERVGVMRRALRAANAQLTLDALEAERWLAEQVRDPALLGVFDVDARKARSEAATQVAGRLAEAASAAPEFRERVPGLVVVVDREGTTVGRNGSQTLRDEAILADLPGLDRVLQNGGTGRCVWVPRSAQEGFQLATYAAVRNAAGEIVGAVVVGAPLDDGRLERTRAMTSDATVVIVAEEGAGLRVVARGGSARTVSVEAITAAVRAPTTASAAEERRGNSPWVIGAAPLDGFPSKQPLHVVTVVPASIVPNLSMLLWPIFGVTALGIALMSVAGWILGDYIQRPVAVMEEGLMRVINGQTELRFELDHPVLGGLATAINTLLNQFTDTPEGSTETSREKESSDGS